MAEGQIQHEKNVEKMAPLRILTPLLVPPTTAATTRPFAAAAAAAFILVDDLIDALRRHEDEIAQQACVLSAKTQSGNTQEKAHAKRKGEVKRKRLSSPPQPTRS